MFSISKSDFYRYLQKTLPIKGLMILVSVISIPFWGLLLWILTNPAFYTGGYRDLWPFTSLWQPAGKAVVEESTRADVPSRGRVRYFGVRFRYQIATGPDAGYQGQGFCYCLDHPASEQRSIVEGATYDVLIFNGNKNIAKLQIPFATSTNIRPNRLYYIGGFLLLVPAFLLGMVWLEYYSGKHCIKKGGPKRIRYQKKRKQKAKAKRKRFRK